MRLLLFMGTILGAAAGVAAAADYTVTLTPEQQTMVAIITAPSNQTVEQYLNDAVARRIRDDYSNAASPIGGKIIQEWPKLQAGQRTAICTLLQLSPCVPEPKK